jgi:hypothetical protein
MSLRYMSDDWGARTGAKGTGHFWMSRARVTG